MNGQNNFGHLFYRDIGDRYRRQAYNDLPNDISGDYNIVKETILKAYELVPEAYRQQFRACKMTDAQTHVEFIRNKERLFERWVNAKNVDNDYDNLRQLILIEELKKCVHPNIKVFLDEQEVNEIYDAAAKADAAIAEWNDLIQ